MFVMMDKADEIESVYLARNKWATRGMYVELDDKRVCRENRLKPHVKYQFTTGV